MGLTKKNMVAMILAGGQGSRLGLMTRRMAKPAVAFGGKYRIIDFALSNCSNSGIDTVGVLTQYKPQMSEFSYWNRGAVGLGPGARRRGYAAAVYERGGGRLVQGNRQCGLSEYELFTRTVQSELCTDPVWRPHL